MAPALPRIEQAGIYVDWNIVYHNHRILFKDLPTNLLPLLKLKIFKSIKLLAGTPIAAIGLPVYYFKCAVLALG
jgi:hypothetical protein